MAVVVLPKTLTAHTTATAEDVMDNLDAILAQVNGNIDDDNLKDGAVLAAALAEYAVWDAGDFKVSGRSVAPTGWLLCDGTEDSRVAQANLFAAIGTKYGAGDGVTTFNRPDFRGRVMMMPDGGVGRITANPALGDSGGNELLAGHGHALTGATPSIPWVKFGPVIPTLGGATYMLVPGGSTDGSMSGRADNEGDGPNDGIQLPPYSTCNVFVKA